MRPLSLLTAILTASLAVGCASAEEGPEEVGETESAIINGELDEGDKATVAILSKGEVYCTGVLVNPYVVATAGHCVDGITPDQVFFGTNPKSKKGVFVDVADSHAHDDFNHAKLLNDIALIGLAELAPAKPVRVAKADTEIEVGLEVRIVGFGLTSGTANNTSPKRVGHTKVDGVGSTTFRFKASPAQTCHGDSGGPAFAKIKGKDTLVGITSAGDADCKSYGRDTRVDAYTDFIDGYTERYEAKITAPEVPNSGCSATGRSAGATGWLAGAVAIGLALGRRRRTKRAI